jgi:hypothetical protein
MNRDTLQQLLASHRAALDRLGVKSLAVFGSVARGEAGPESDVDILVEFSNTPGFDQYMDLKFFFEDLLKRHVDLVTPDALRPRIRPNVEREAVRVA